MVIVTVDQIDYLSPLLKPVDCLGSRGLYVRQRGSDQLYQLSSSCRSPERLRRLGLDYPIRIVHGSRTAGVRADMIRSVGSVAGPTSVFVTAGGFLQTCDWPDITKHAPRGSDELISTCYEGSSFKVYWLLCTADYLRGYFVEAEEAVRLYRLDGNRPLYRVSRGRFNVRCYYRKSDLVNLRPRYADDYYDFLKDLRHVPSRFDNYMTRAELVEYDRLMGSGYHRHHPPSSLSFGGVRIDFSFQDRMLRVVYETFKDAVVTCCDELLYNPNFTWGDLEAIKAQLYGVAEKPRRLSIEQVLYWDLDILDQFLAEAGYSEFERLAILAKVGDFRKSGGRNA